MTIEQQQAMFEAAAAANPAYPAERFAGRGIVICAGGARLFTCAYVSIGILRRHLDCRLPIQLWHLGPEEIGPPMRALLEELDVEVIDALAPSEREPMRIVGGWELKPYAIIHSRFREVFLLDADNVALIDPARLFDLPQYAATGAVFWPDIVRLRADNPIWRVCGVAARNLPSFESGQLLVDKQRCWAALQLTLHMNAHSDFFYEHLYGDKDTFLMAWLRLAQPYAITSQIPQVRYGVLHQRGFEGETLFQHRNKAKWSYGSGNPRIPDFQFESECLALLAELAQRWTGWVFNPPPRSAAARAVEAGLIRGEWFNYLKSGAAEKRLQLLSDNRIGEGRADEEFYWWVEDGGEGEVLAIQGRSRLISRLRQLSDGTWQGRSGEREAWEVRLVPQGGAAAGFDPLIARAAALLDSILDSPAGHPADASAAGELSAALKVLHGAVPGFATALRQRLAGMTPQDRAAASLARALAEPAVTSPTWSGDGNQGSRSRRFNLATHYETKI